MSINCETQFQMVQTLQPLRENPIFTRKNIVEYPFKKKKRIQTNRQFFIHGI